ncbi:hypothetical protein JSMCR1_p107 (plasmid) [Escherichia coli]|uniref:Uncharacterized protein n=1 Tax=Escherichia coli TaxID=562 RepID=A0A2R4A8E6_ECOLX|nr:hypothetical protein [Escherichia coli]QOC74396.1 hypothetical protein [Enterobacter hormaechei subsp. steigerwaltii]UCS41545.1 hypothetical protein [Proteus mirabilis]UCS41620.1 hypothetical protein [Proteus mirabilis]UUF21788.1 hypothetical protein JSMCR1_p107 [Escherichia coli]
MITYLAVLIIFAARNTYFKRKVFICCLYSEESKESNLNNKNRLYEIRILRFPLKQVSGNFVEIF